MTLLGSNSASICPAYRFATLLVTGEEESAISIAVEAIEDLDEEEFVELEGEVELSVHLPRALYELQEDGRLLLLRATSTGSVPLQQSANKHWSPKCQFEWSILIAQKHYSSKG